MDTPIVNNGSRYLPIKAVSNWIGFLLEISGVLDAKWKLFIQLFRQQNTDKLDIVFAHLPFSALRTHCCLLLFKKEETAVRIQSDSIKIGHVILIYT